MFGFYNVFKYKCHNKSNNIDVTISHNNLIGVIAVFYVLTQSFPMPFHCTKSEVFRYGFLQ